ncbi:tryptophan dimethylallyltransferase family protein [Dactylosporangium sp. NPDC048998]|uniref:tryptophan dimethylallyltransferase family protein n=1 Tax=Dactylosporangium sp. NPDC048998 TaxID=3363976 RepID=UPI0037140570
MDGLSVFEHLGGQLTRLCDVAGLDPDAPMDLLRDLLGPVGPRRLSEPPAWPSDVADDHTPVEFSIAYNEGEPPSLRILGETIGSPPGVLTNLSASYEFLRTQADRFGLSTSRLEQVQDLFDTEHPQGEFALWWSLVFRSGRRPELKVYFNPEVKGVERAPELVAEALHRLGLHKAYRAMLDHAVRPGELGQGDRLTFFALDLHDGPHARVKLYVTHHDTEVEDAVRAAGAVDGVDLKALAEFCTVARGGPRPFDGRPLVGSYTLTEGVDTPVGYSVYVPIRSYVHDDEEARDRVVALLARHGFDSSAFDRAVTAVTQRPLRAGVGLIAHVSLRLGPPRPGVTVYLSAEAYQVAPPRPRQAPAIRSIAKRRATQTAA